MAQEETKTENTAKATADKYHFDLYKRYPITLVSGKGVHVKDVDGNTYLDALAGIAVNGTGHCHPKVVKAIQEQAAELIHISNLYYNEPQSKLAKLLTEVSGMDRAFFCNSGAEAVEGSLKLARKYAHEQGKDGHIISMTGCFHGRTLGTIAMGKKKYQKGFDPMPPGFNRAKFNDIASLKEKVNDSTVAIIMETVQGEGGIHVVKPEFLQTARDLCDKHNALLILDEVQCGIARTGMMFAYQHFGVEPDVVASAKALGGGFPIGAVMAKEHAADAFDYGNHGTTYGGNPLACAAAAASLEAILDENLMEHAAEMGHYFMNKIRSVGQNWDAIKEVRGLGLMIGVELNFPGAKVVEEMLERGVLSNCASNTVMRIVPPLVISKQELDRVIEVLIESIKKVEEDVEN